MGILSFLKEEIRADVRTIRSIIRKIRKGEPITKNTELAEEIKDFSWQGFIEDNWMELLVYILLIIIGMRIGYWMMAHRCNDHIAQNCAEIASYCTQKAKPVIEAAFNLSVKPMAP